jgi:hypothetical protein
MQEKKHQTDSNIFIHDIFQQKMKSIQEGKKNSKIYKCVYCDKVEHNSFDLFVHMDKHYKDVKWKVVNNFCNRETRFHLVDRIESLREDRY